MSVAHIIDSPVPQPEEELAQLHTSGSSAAGSSWSRVFFFPRRKNSKSTSRSSAELVSESRPSHRSSRRGPSCTTLRGSPSSIRSARSLTTGTGGLTLLTGSAPWVSKPAVSKGSLAATSTTSPLRSTHSSLTSLSDDGEWVVVVTGVGSLASDHPFFWCGPVVWFCVCVLLQEYRVWVLLRGDFTGCSPVLSSWFDSGYQFIRQSTGGWTSDPVVGWLFGFRREVHASSPFFLVGWVPTC